MAIEYKHFPGLRLLLVKIRDTGLAHLPMGLLQTWHMAMVTGSRAYVFYHRRPLNFAFFTVEPGGVPLARRTRWRATLYQALWLVDDVPRTSAAWLRSGRWRPARGIVRAVRTRVAARLKAGKKTLSRRRQQQLRRILEFIDQRWPQTAPPKPFRLTHCRPWDPPLLGIDLRRRYCSQPIPVEFPLPVRREAEASALALGIPVTGRVVTLHVREAGYKRLIGQDERPKDSNRNARIESYFPAIDYLVSQGYTVVRIGDRAMTPVRRDGVVDLATDARRTDLVELWAIFRSSFFIGCDSGPSFTPLFTNVPALLVNVTNPLGQFPARTTDRYILKHLNDPEQGLLSIAGMLDAIYRTDRMKRDRLTFVDNSPHDIIAAVEEMVASLEVAAPPTESQQDYHAMMLQIRQLPHVRAHYSLTGAPDDCYLGEGRIIDAFARSGLREPAKSIDTAVVARLG